MADNLCSFCLLTDDWCERCYHEGEDAADVALCQASGCCDEGFRLVIVSTAGDIVAEPIVSEGKLIKDLKEEIAQAGNIAYFSEVAALLHDGVELSDEETIAVSTLSSDDVLVAIMQVSLPSLQMFWACPKKLHWTDDDIRSVEFDRCSKTVTFHERIPKEAVSDDCDYFYFECGYELVGEVYHRRQKFDYCIREHVCYSRDHLVQPHRLSPKGEFTGHMDLSLLPVACESDEPWLRRNTWGRLYFHDQRPGCEILHVGSGSGVYCASAQQLVDERDRHIDESVEKLRCRFKKARGVSSRVHGHRFEFLVDLHLGLLAGNRHRLSAWEALEVDYGSDVVMSAASHKKGAAGEGRRPLQSRKAARALCAASLSQGSTRDTCVQQKVRRVQVQRRWTKMNGNALD
eukprot:TRINITY_DN19094_c0_g3_i1.p1 TRINITY_DN19094_c0_g3~~TRINITY_DN19094_c0_g3_i1.p1  ORF type:complete len:403 (-),score=30.95 TRINITY_DN19094_c0_g3_i1:204-1412(-)